MRADQEQHARRRRGRHRADGNTVRRWETGERWPDPRFRKNLVTLLGRPASQLGLLTPDELAARPDVPEPVDALERLLTVLDGHPHGSGIVESYTVITAQHRRLYWMAPADTMLASALSHTQLGVRLLSIGAGEARRHLAGSLAESALLGARLAFFDLRRVTLAERCFAIATTSSPAGPPTRW